MENGPSKAGKSGEAGSMKDRLEKPPLPPGNRLARYTLWNLAGMCAPIVVALFAMPPIIHGLGEDRFGLLSMVWMLVGYFTILDLGVGRALTRLAAEKIGLGREEELPALFWTACAVMVALGTCAAVAVVACAPWLVSVLKVPPPLQSETLRSFQTVAFSLPVVVMTAGMIGMLEAQQKFALINAVRVPLGTFTFLGPLLVLPFSKNLWAVVLVLLAGRLAEWLVYFTLCLRVVPALRRGFHWKRQYARPLMTTGGWITVSTLLMPLMVHVDRFLIGGIVAVGAVTYYATPSEIVVKLLIFPRAWVAVLFPTFAAHFKDRQTATSELFARSFTWLWALLFPLAMVLVAFAPEGFSLWLGATFAEQSAPVMRWLTAGVFVYCLAWIPFSFLQGIGRPDIPARVHLVEFPLYVTLASGLIRWFGIVGAAMAWLVRALLELAVMLACARPFAPVLGQYTRRWTIAALLVTALFVVVATPASPLVRLAATGCGLLIWVAVAWLYLLTSEERASLVANWKSKPQ